MTLDATQPSDQALVSELPSYIRAISTEVNSLSAGTNDVTMSEVTIAAGSTALVVGSDLGTANIEFVLASGGGVATIAQIRGGTQGQVKIFIFQDNQISITDGVKSNGGIYLNQLPVASTYDAQQDDVLALINIDGDGSSTYGYWKELWRQSSVK